MNNKVQYLIEKELINIGLRPGDNVLVHSDSTAVRELTGLKWSDSLDLLKNCFLNILGKDGTLIVPTFNWDFCKGKSYVHEKTRSQVGMFTNNILFDDQSLRSFHPIYSFAAIGPQKKEILNNISKSSFGNNSVFHKLHELNAKIILFNFDLGTTFVHYVEQKLGVEYRYIKYFTGKVLIEVLVTKTVLSVGYNQDVFKFVAQGTELIEVENGSVKNESINIALQTAIETAVLQTINEGVAKNYWEIRHD